MTLKEIDSYDFIFNAMREYGDEYNEDDFALFMSLDNKCYGVYDNDDRLIAFGCVVIFEEKPYVSYTWNDGTFNGKRGYVFGFNELLIMYPDLQFGSNGSRFNKTKRSLNAKCGV